MPIVGTIQDRVVCKYCGKELALGYKIMHEQKFCFKRPKKSKIDSDQRLETKPIGQEHVSANDKKETRVGASVQPPILDNEDIIFDRLKEIDRLKEKDIDQFLDVNKNTEAIMVEKPKNGKEVKELKVEVEETVKKQQIEAEKAEKKRREEIRSVVQEMLSEIKEKEQEVKLAEVDVDEVVKKGKDKDKIGDKKDELIELRKELNDLKKEYSDLQIKLKENEEDRHKKEGAIKRGIVSMFGSWIIF